MVACLILWFTAMNFIAYALFARSHKRVQHRQSALSRPLLIASALLGGGVGAYFAVRRFRGTVARSSDQPLIAIVGLVQISLVIMLLADILFVDFL